MKRVLVILLAASCSAWTCPAEDAGGGPTYTFIKLERLDVGTVKRARVWISVPDGSGSNGVMRAMDDALAKSGGMHADCVAVIREGELPGAWPYTVGNAVHAPGGDWSRAFDGLDNPDRDGYAVKYELRPGFFSAAPRPALCGLTAVETAAVASEVSLACTIEEEVVLRKNPMADRREMNAARRRAAALVGRKRGISADDTDAIWSAYHSDVLRCVYPGMKP